MSMDIINWEILEDGTISLKTPGISKENHVSADELLDQLAENMGGAVTIEKLKKGTCRWASIATGMCITRWVLKKTKLKECFGVCDSKETLYSDVISTSFRARSLSGWDEVKRIGSQDR